jgi:hypothetical protein
MAVPQISDDVWYRCVPKGWLTAEGFRADIRPTVLENLKIERALFIVAPGSRHEYGVFIPMSDIRSALAGESTGRNGSIPFSVSLTDSTVNEQVASIRKVIAE